MNYFGIRLKYLRKQDNLTQKELADRTGVGRSTICLYENGNREPDFETVEMFADFFNVDMSTFFPGGETEKTATDDGSGLSPLEARLMELIRRLSDDQKAFLLAQIELLLKQQG